jgi:hypothetical protein
VLEVRTLTLCLAALCLAPLWAEEELPPVRVGFEYEKGLIRTGFTNEFFHFELDYDLEVKYADKILFSWLAYGQDPRSPWDIALEIEPAMWESEISRELGHDPIRYDKFYVGVRYFADWVDARLFPFGIATDTSEKVYPHLDLRRLHLARINNRTDLIVRGYASTDELNWAAGVDIKLPWSLNAKLLYGSQNFEWAIGYSTVINR